MLAGSVEKKDLGKAFGFHEALDTAGALIGPAVALLLLSTGHGFRTIFWAALAPGVICVILFALITRDPRRGRPEPVPLHVPMPPGFWRLMAPVAIFGLGNFATAFFTLRAAQIMQPELSHAAALAAAVGFYLAHNAVGAAVSFPAGWLADHVGKAPVLAAAYLTFAAACLVGLLGHGWFALGLMALLLLTLVRGDLMRPGRQRGRRVACQLAGRCPPAGHCFWFSQWHQRRRRPRVKRGRRSAVDRGQSGSLARPGIGSVRGRGADLVGETTKTRLIDRWPGQSSRSSAARTSGSRPCSTG